MSTMTMEAVAGSPAARYARSSFRPVPGQVAEVMTGAGLAPESCRLCVSSPLLPDGRFGETWLAVGEEQVLVTVHEESAARMHWSSPLARIRAARTQKVTGGGVLVLEVEGRAEDVLRFDLSNAGLFGTIAQQVQRFVAPDGPEQGGPAKRGTPGLQAAVSVAAPLAGPRPPLDFSQLLEKERQRFCPRCSRRLPKETKVCPYCVERGTALRRVLSFALPFRGQIALMMGLMVCGTLVDLCSPYLQKVLIDDVFGGGRRELLLPLVLGMGVIQLLRQLLVILRSRLGVRVGTAVTHSIQQRVYRHLQTLSLGYFNRQATGALMARVNSDTRQMQDFLVEGVQYTIINTLMVLGVFSVFLYYDPWLALLVFLPAPVVVLLSGLFWRRVARRYRVLWIAISGLSAYLNDALSGIRVIKAFGQEESEVQRYRRKVDLVRDQMIAAEQTWQTLIPILALVVQSSMLLLWYFGGLRVVGLAGTQELKLGQLWMYVWLLGMAYGPLQSLTRLNDWLTRSLTSAARVFEVLDTAPDIVEDPDPVALAQVEGRIELRNVVFGYEKHNPVIKNLSLSIEPGEMVGFVGQSGAGKSTLINLIGRLYDTDQGQVLIDGVDVRKIRMADLRRHCGFVLQDTFLFNGSIAENIAFSKPGATREEIVQAAVTANAHSFIMRLNDGYDTLVGERGAKLSGGERQRISIARAILHNPRILILDEATSSVDTETEAKIQMALGELVKGRTTIAIAHRLSTLRHAHRLFVIKNGEKAEEGTHAQLMELPGGVYRKLVEIQSEWSRTIGVGK